MFKKSPFRTYFKIQRFNIEPEGRPYIDSCQNDNLKKETIDLMLKGRLID
jgi:hypothetical protein